MLRLNRLTEALHVNRSLAALSDVLSAIGDNKDGGYVPYRNSKLTQACRFETPNACLSS
jgi:hypothetical protein